MCILCVIQKWSRKVATMLPWLVIPLIGLWLLSQFLPPAFRFEITSPRLACVLVLLATLFWYEILMPQLSTWRTRRNARIKEKKRLEIIEMHKLKKNAIRKCRNCRTPYRDQNPCGGKFNCSYCGHVSKRPLFDPSLSPGLDRSGNFIDFFGRVWSENNWICGQDWLETGGCYVNGSFSGKSGYGKNNSGGYYNSVNDNIFSFLLVFVCKSFAAIFLGVIWLIRKLFRISFSEDDDASTDSDIVGLAKKGEDGVNCNETRSEKARRKMEEKRQARLEKEQLEEEERKQREEVARLVEERRKIRDENDRRYKVPPRVKNDKKEARKNQQERNKEQDRGSSKSSSDVDELEKRACKEIKRNKKGETESREHHKTVNENGSRSSNHNRGSVGTRYLDRVRGNLFPSSSTVTGGGLFGKGTNVPAYTSNTRERKSSASSDHATKRDVVQPERAFKKSNGHADDQNQNRPAHFEPQPCPPPKRSWHQLFSRSSPTGSSTSTNVISRPSGNSQTEVQSSVASGVPMIQGFDTPISVGFPFPLSNTSFGNSTNSTGLQLLSNPTELPKEPNSSEQRYYDPDPTSLIGPVSESLDNFQLDHGFVPDLGFKKPSPIESCVSPLWNSDEKDASSFFSPSRQEKTNLPVENDSTTNENGWQMWNSPICPDTLGLVGGNATWYLPQRTQEKTKFPLEEHVLPNTNGFVHPASDDPWGLRASYGSISTSNNSLSFNQQAGITHNELVYGIPSGSSIHHPFHPYHGSVWAKNEKGAAPVCAKGVRTTSTMIAPSGGLYSPSDVQSLWSYD